jgi:hypothetical protein
MTTSKQSQPAARRRGELHRANGDRQVAQAIGAHRRLERAPAQSGPRLGLASEKQPRSTMANPNRARALDRARALAPFHAALAP